MNPFRYLELALALLLLGAGAYGVWSYHHLSVQAERIPELEAKVALLATGYQTLSNETIRRSEFDSALREARAEFSRNLDQASREDPETHSYLNTRIPNGVRNATHHTSTGR